MSKMKPVLGRGLASLIPRTVPSPPAQRTEVPDDGISHNVTVHIDLDRVSRNPFQPRADFDQTALDELRLSIQEKGVIQPITVRRVDDGYQLISGERRVRAAREAGLATIPAYIIAVDTNEEMLELALIENLQREHLNPIEVAISYRRLIDECSLTQEQVSQRIGKDRTTITNTLRLLRLPQAIQDSVRKGEITSGHARAILSVEDVAGQMVVYEKVRKKGLSVRQVERLVRNVGKVNGAKKPGVTVADSSFSGVEDRLRQALGTKVQVSALKNGKGEIVVEYYSLDDLERIIEMFEGNQGYV